jgi:thymidylate synthase (FAD)
MEVKLINISQPSEEMRAQGVSDLQDQIAYCARVSNPSNQLNTGTSEKLIRYLITHKHWSPLEMVSACLEITTTRDIARQILRHRSFSFQEFSQRYADPTQDLSFVVREARLQDTKNRQNSIDLEPTIGNAMLSDTWRDRQRDLIRKAQETYAWAIEKGIAKEQARAVLPEGIMESRIYMNGTLRSWVHYIELRSGVETQKEHREVARACAEALTPHFPMITEFVQN